MKVRLLVQIIIFCISVHAYGALLSFTNCGSDTIEAVNSSDQHAKYSQGLTVWFDEPASNSGKESWLKVSKPNYGPHANPDRAWDKYALPIGNGHIGGMVYGHITEERIQFNEKTLWTGGPGTKGYNNPNVEDAYQQLPRIRELVLEGRIGDAEQLAKNTLKGIWKGNDIRFGKYQTFGEVQIKTGISASGIKNYQRALSLDSSLVTISFAKSDTVYKRRYFCSYPHNVMVMRFECNKPKAQNLAFTIKSPHNHIIKNTKNGIVLSGRVKDNDLGIAARVHVTAKDGQVNIEGDQIIVSHASTVTFLLTADTDYQMNYPSYRGEDALKNTLHTIKKAKRLSYKTLKETHVADYKGLFDRVQLEINNSSLLTNIPTDERIRVYKKDPTDNGLEVLYYQFGRYLLISSSRKGNLPANLQGVWNNELYPPWLSDYHININLQMNYWGAGNSNLSECNLPLIDYIDNLREPGAITAKSYHNARGWTTNMHSNAWGFTAPDNYGVLFWQYFPLSGAWLCQHVWEHYDFTRDNQYLEKTAYPILKSQAEFVEDYLYKLGDSIYVSFPSWSPEHGSVSIGTTTDHAMAWDLLNNVVEAATILDVDLQDRKKWAGIRDSICSPKIGHWGQLQEWFEDRDNENDQHRHVNHLFGLYPGRQISPITTPGLAQAAHTSLLARGDGATGWSMGWKINFWARLLDGDHAYKLVQNLLKHGTSTNLFDLHPPFQIDGNLGGMAGIAEMLLQSHAGFIHLLPALPSAWKNGKVNGLLARGAFEIDMQWNDEQSVKGQLYSKKGGPCILKFKSETIKINTEAGKSYDFEFPEKQN
ncbi:glycoside hydrolase family 95 protein [Carboxylicivirga marina]|uniref:Glycoside hydrolase family 95 protein n=1 Tax=Carboxylicivirga marina TaxID=2800988 RepID=A0ABS1HPQ8_9BACT|nr:glycoside hydrolase family 95 protein [Carboxylicivirga marina]MBK3519668.1 glycoside hydrolase family 95 protein [Carboxylicivirga marina]